MKVQFSTEAHPVFWL